MAKIINLEINIGAEVLTTTAFGLGENELTRRRKVNKEIERIFINTDTTSEHIDALNGVFDEFCDFTKSLISLIREEERKIEEIETILKDQD